VNYAPEEEIIAEQQIETGSYQGVERLKKRIGLAPLDHPVEITLFVPHGGHRIVEGGIESLISGMLQAVFDIRSPRNAGYA